MQKQQNWGKKNSALEIKVNKDVGGDMEKGEAGI